MDGLAARLRSQRGLDPGLSVAGVALAAAALSAFGRMEGDWGTFPLLLLVAAPCVLLFAAALAPGREAPAGLAADRLAPDRLAPWQAVFLIAGLVLLVTSLLQFVRVTGSDTVGSGGVMWTFGVTAAAAAWIAVRFELPAATLLATAAFGVAVLALVAKADSSASLATYRNVILVLGLAYLLAARSIRGTRLAHSHVLVSTAAFAIGLGAVLGIVGELNLGSLISFDPEVSSSGSSDFLSSGSSDNRNGWELLLLVVSIGALVYAAWQGYRGSGLVGLLGLAAFFTVIGDGSLAGWPIVLAVVALAGVLLALPPGSRAGPGPEADRDPAPAPPGSG